MNSVLNMHCRDYFIVCSFLLMAGCYKKGENTSSPPNFVPAGVTEINVTYTNYIHTVLKNNCGSCHGKDGSAEKFWFNANTYENAVQYGTRIMETIVENSMPPVPRKPFSGADKSLIKAWINKGLPE
ncbi:MAG: hypothetical protein ABI760_13565 [Ferruginibacter sp.]